MKYRAEIDGLRAFAVLSVVAYHAFPNWLRGGFVGVDIFFVISGYLITGIVFEELSKGNFKLLNFFGRRIRRLFPALTLVMVAALIFGWFLLLADEYAQLGKHISSGVIYILNFVLVDEAGYFDNVAETKPMLHLWSLAVEEQFYIVWPLVLVLAWKRKVNLIALILILATVSFASNLRYVGIYPSETFFWPFGRVWELLSGSVLAYIVRRNANVPQAIGLAFGHSYGKIFRANKITISEVMVANLMAALGFSLLVFGVFWINEDIGFPGGWATIPVAGSVFVIAAGSSAWLNRTLLMNPLAIWFGLISYPLYLWHWPILSFLRITEGLTPSRELRIIAVLLSIFLAWITYRFVEKSFRNNSPKLFLKTIVLVLLSIVIGLIGLSISQGKIVNSEQGKIVSSEESVPQLNYKESVDTCSLHFPQWNIENRNKCRFQKSSGNTVALIGDSHAGQLFIGVAEKFIDSDQSVIVFPVSCQAPLMNVSSAYDVKNDETLKLLREKGFKFILEGFDYVLNTDSIHTVILAHTPRCDSSIKDVLDESVLDYEEILTRGFERTLKSLELGRKDVVIVLDNPYLETDPSSCVRKRISAGLNKGCQPSERSHREHRLTKVYNRVALNASKRFANVSIVDLAEALCVDGVCNAVVDEKLMYWDRGHLSLDGSRLVAPYILDKVKH